MLIFKKAFGIMSKKCPTTKSLATKLSEKVLVGRVVEVRDIEDSVKYFSPVQTRQQRNINNRQINKLKPTTELSGNTLLTSPNNVANPKGRKTPKTLLVLKEEKNNEKKAKDTKQQIAEQNFKAEDSTKWEPLYWQTVLENIRTMRSLNDAPVDTMGCHKCSDDKADEKTQRFQKLVSLMLSSQTKDEITFEAMKRLKNVQMTPQVIVDMERSRLEELLKPVSFYKNKAKYMQLASQILIDKYDSDIPRNIKELEGLPGVGPKMAHICMATAWNEVTGIGVDVHVHRICNRLQWLPKPTKEPEQTRVALESWLPRDVWQEVNYLMVGFGQTICKAVRPQCTDCLNRYICPASEYKKAAKTKNGNDSKDSIVTKKSKKK